MYTFRCKCYEPIGDTEPTWWLSYSQTMWVIVFCSKHKKSFYRGMMQIVLFVLKMDDATAFALQLQIGVIYCTAICFGEICEM